MGEHQLGPGILPDKRDSNIRTITQLDPQTSSICIWHTVHKNLPFSLSGHLYQTFFFHRINTKLEVISTTASALIDVLKTPDTYTTFIDCS